MSGADVRQVSGRLLAAIMVAMTANMGELALAITCARWMMLRGGAWVQHNMPPLAAAIHASRLHSADLTATSRLSRVHFGGASVIRTHLQGFPR